MDKIYLSALPFQTDETLLKDWLEPYGQVHRVELHADWEKPTHEPYAHVEMENGLAAIEALDGKKIGATHLRVHLRRNHG